MKTLIASAVAGTLLSLLAATSQAQSTVCFLKIEGAMPAIEGESTYTGHEKEIQVVSFQSGVTQTISIGKGGGGAGAGKAEFSSLKVFKYVDKASPALFVACAAGKHIPTATLFVVSPPAATAAALGVAVTASDAFFKIVLTDAFVSSVNESGDHTDSQGNLLETITLEYSTIAWIYTPTDPQTSLPDPTKTVKGGWDIVRNKKLVVP